MSENKKNVEEYNLKLNAIKYFITELEPYRKRKITQRELKDKEYGYKKLKYREGDNYLDLSIGKYYTGERQVKVSGYINGRYFSASEYEQVIGREYLNNTVETWGDMIDLWNRTIETIHETKLLDETRVKDILEQAEKSLNEYYKIKDEAMENKIYIERY